MLGIALIDLGRFEEAAACLHEAVAASPDNSAFRRALATALERGGDAAAAASTLAEAVVDLPANVELRTAGIMVEMRRRAFAKAAALAEQARREGAIDACVMGLMGHALSSLGRHADAASAYREALKLGPEDPYVRHLVAAAGVLPQATRAPKAYLETVFDGYASRFEAHLISLGYRAPGLLRAALLAHLPPSDKGTQIGPVLDLGCGTGLVGVVLSDLELGGLVGVDASNRMLDEARRKGLYSELVHGDLESMLHISTNTWPIVMAADVLCYFGALDGVMKAVHARLLPGGLFLFTVEELAVEDADCPPWQLGRQGRYAHRQEHITLSAAAAGFRVVELRQEILRYEADAPVGGLLAVMQRVRHDG